MMHPEEVFGSLIIRRESKLILVKVKTEIIKGSMK